MTNNHLLLYRLAELMLEKQQHIIALDDLFEDEQIGAFVRSIQIDSPYQQLIFEGVLTETNREEQVMVTFTLEGYFHYILGEVIERQNEGKEAKALKELLENNKLIGVVEGVEQCLVRDVEKNDLSRLMWLIDEGGKALEASAYPLAQAFLIHSTERVMDELLDNPTENDINIFESSVNILESLNKISESENCYKYLSDYNFNNLNFNNVILQKLKIKITSSNTMSNLLFEKLSKMTYSTKIEEEKQEINFLIYKELINKSLLVKGMKFANYKNLYSVGIHETYKNYFQLIYPLMELNQHSKAEKIYKYLKADYIHDGIFLNWSGMLFQSWYEIGSANIKKLLKAINFYEKALEVQTKKHGNFSIQCSKVLENLGYALYLKRDYLKAKDILERSISIQNKSFNKKIVYQTGNTYGMLGIVFLELKTYSKALKLLELSAKCKLIKTDENSLEMAWNYIDKGDVYLNMNNLPKAKKYYEKVLNIRKNELGFENPLTIVALNKLNSVQ